MKLYAALALLAAVAFVMTEGRGVPRGGRQEEAAPAADAAAPADQTAEEAAPAASARDAGGDSGVPAWCDPKTNMGAWLNFRKMRTWCANKGFTNFGAYGGVPSDEEGAEAAEGKAAPAPKAAAKSAAPAEAAEAAPAADAPAEA